MEQKLLSGDVMTTLRTLPDNHVQAIITSPPYFGLRVYGTSPQIWDADSNCQHEWVEYIRPGISGGKKSEKVQVKGQENFQVVPSQQQQQCRKCSAWCGELGSEPVPTLYIKHLVDIFREARRVLREDGICWIVISDSFASGKGSCFNPGGGADSIGTDERKAAGAYPLHRGNKSTLTASNLKPKDLLGIPFMLAISLRDDGWYWRGCIPWLCRNKMPSSVTDRPSADVEYVLMMTKEPTYFYDYVATRIPSAGVHKGSKFNKGKTADHQLSRTSDEDRTEMLGRNRRASDSFFESVQEIADGGTGLIADEEGDPLAIVANTQGSGVKHFAAFPSRLIEPFIRASTSEYGCCSGCGAPYKRVIEKRPVMRPRPNSLTKREGEEGTGNFCPNDVAGVEVVTTGWSPTCECIGEMSPDFLGDDPKKMTIGTVSMPQVVPCIILDQFVGSGTSLMVAKKLGLRGIGIELNPEYIEISRKRIEEQK